MERIDASPSHDRLDIRPLLYAIWLDSRFELSSSADPECTADLERSWRRRMRPRIQERDAAY